MSKNIDERVVAMKFQNSQFQSGVSETLSSLDKLKKGLNFEAATKGLNSLATMGKNFTLAGMASSIDAISSKFTVMTGIALAAITNITNKAINMGTQLVKSLTIDPIKAGFDEYELKMGSIQTILANTQKYGTTLGEVTSALDDLNNYADKTIYNFGDMTKNIGLFTNAGIRIEDATSMIKGFSNAAAASGTNAQQAAGAAYQLSQALSAGKVTLMDWKSLQNAGMGNKNMQQGILDIASAMGTLEMNGTSAEEVQTNFNGSLEKGWLTADVMSKYLNIMAGDMTRAEMAALGLSDAQIDMFEKQQKTAEEAATKVRTFTQLLGTMREAVGSAWSETFGILLGDFDEATELFTNVNNKLGPMIGAAGAARNEILTAWKNEGGRTMVIDAITNAFEALMAIIKPISEAFREIFPPVTAAQLINITQAVLNFTKTLMPSANTLDNIKSTAKGFFAVLDIGRMIFMQVISLFGRLLGETKGMGGGFLEITGNIGDFLVKVRDALKNGDGLAKVFKVIGDTLEKPIELLKKFGAITIDWVDVDSLAEVWQKVADAIQLVWKFIKPAIDFIVDGLAQVGGAIKEAFKSADPSLLVGLLNVGLLGGIGIIIKKFIDKISGLFGGIGGGIIDTIKGVFTQLTDTMGAMQDKLKAEALMKIAIAIALLTASVVALSFIDTGKLFTVLGAMTIMFGQMAAMLYVMDKAISTTGGAAKLGVLAAALILLAAAMVIFAAAVLIMSSMDWNELARGLTGMAVGLGLMIATVKLIKGSEALKLQVIAGGIAVMAVGLLLLATALKIMGTMGWGEVATGLVVLAGSLAILVIAMKAMQSGVVGAAAMILIAIAMNILAGALKIFATMSWDEIGRAMVVLAGSLAILAAGMYLMTGSVVGAAALIVAAAAITLLAGALKIVATMSWDDIGRTMVVLGGALAILAVGLTLMIAALPGAAALLVAAAALVILVPVLLALGSMSWETIGTGLGALALALGLLAIAGIALIPAIPGLVGLGIAIALVGVGALAAGIGISMFAAGLALLATSGAAALGLIGPAIVAFAAQIPLIAQQIGLGIIEIANVIAENGAAILGAITTILLALIQAIVDVTPPLIDAAVVMIMALVEAIVTLIPFLVDAGMRLIIGILDGIARNVGKVITKGTDVIVAFMQGIGKAIPRLLQAGADLIVDFLNGLATTIRNNTERINAAGRNVASAIIDGMTSGIRNGITTVINAVKNMAESALNAAKRALGIASPSKEFTYLGEFSAEGYAGGIDDETGTVVKSAEDMAAAAVNAVKSSISDLSNAVSGNIDAQPVIRPVLDLSAIKRDGATISRLIPRQTLSVDGTAVNARLASSGYTENQQAKLDAYEAKATQPGTELNFTQINNSPKALTPAEIYRQTKNQLSVTKEELDK